MSARILVADKLSEKGLAVLQSAPDVQVDDRAGITAADLLASIGEYDALIIRSDTRVTADVVARAARLKVIGRAGVGLDNVDVAAATRAGIIVMNTPDGNTISASEHTMALMLALARHIPQAHASLASGKWERASFVGTELYGKKLGIVGLGRIGSEVARRARGFEMKIVGVDPYCLPERARTLGVELVPLESLLAESDFITVHVPRSKETVSLIGAPELSRCKKGVRVVNCARGGIIDEAALADAIRSGHVAGAALDVFLEEPPRGNPLVGLPQVVATPHLGASTEEAQENVAEVIARQVLDVLQGRTIANAVNLPALDADRRRELQPLLDLGERLASLAAQLAPGRMRRVTITMAGAATDAGDALSRSILRGLLLTAHGEKVNYVNSMVLAKEAGIEVSATSSPDAGSHAMLVAIRVEGEAGSRSVAGTLVPGAGPRIVEIDAHRVDIAPEGNLILFFNRDVPGVLGRVATILGDARVNIAALTNGRLAAGSDAVTILSVDDEVPTGVLSAISAVPGLRDARVVRL
jgi:D-3-phosphoglycerate dehydrogenase